MPNWVYNTMTVSGPEEVLTRFIEKMSQPRPNGVLQEDGSYAIETKEDENASALSFWNAVAPTDLQNYFDGTNWYHWNIDNWGTKWDAGMVETDRYSKDSAYYTFETAWGAPEAFYKAVSEQWPELEFSVTWEEEQGFGEEFDMKNGEIKVLRTWDIPESHQDFVDQDKEDQCICTWSDNEEEWFEDCPRD